MFFTCLFIETFADTPSNIDNSVCVCNKLALVMGCIKMEGDANEKERAFYVEAQL